MSRQVDDLDPALLADLDSEAEYAQATQRRKFMPRIKIERGQAMLLRFLPVEIGLNKHWLGRFAQHWVHNRATFCRRHTSEHLGGDKNYECPICKIVDNGLRHQNKTIVERAEKCVADPRWFGVVLPLMKDAGKGRPTSIPEPECVTAHEFAMYRTMFEKLRFIATRFAVKGTQGIVDITNGQDIWVQRTGRGYEFQPGGSAPLWGEGEDPQTAINKIWATVIVPDIKMPEKEQESEFFHKIKEFLLTGGGGFDNTRGGGSSGRGGRGFNTESDDLDQDGGAPPGNLPNRARGGRGVAPVPATDDLSLEAGTSTADESLTAGTETLEPPVPTPRPAPVVHATPIAPAPVTPAAPVAQPKPAPVIQAAPIVASAPKVVAPTSKLVPPPRTASSHVPAPAATPVVPPIAGATADDEEIGVAPESRDSAPPITAEPPVETPAPATPAPAAPAPSNAPPQVRPGGTRLGASLQSRLKAFQGAPVVPTVPDKTP
jgi:hypothetical protein